MNTQTEHSDQAGGREPDNAGGAHQAAQSERAGEPSEEQLRAAYEAELSRITSVDMVLQATASLLNIGAHRLGLTGGPAAEAGAQPRDLEQVRDAIDAVRGLLPVIERRAPAELRPLRDALAQLQMAYSREVQPAAAVQGAAAQEPPAQAPAGGQRPPDPESAPAPADPPPDDGSTETPGPGPAESSGRLWVPGR